MDWDCMVNPELIHIDSDCTNFFQQEIEFGWFKAEAAVWDTGQIFFTLIHPFFSLLFASQGYEHWLDLGVSCTVGHKGDGSADDVSKRPCLHVLICTKICILMHTFELQNLSLDSLKMTELAGFYPCTVPMPRQCQVTDFCLSDKGWWKCVLETSYSRPK